MARIDAKEFFFDQQYYATSCQGKVKYENEWQAKYAAEEQFQYNKVKLSWYKCDFCRYWHLTSKYSK